jgi:ligand-binding SRPBCC domain-containing protein
MPFYQLKHTQKIPASIVEAWKFISSPINLKEITPGYLGFEVTGDTDISKMYPGMIITYKVSPLFGIKLNWMTEITHVKYNEYFVDEQRIGPYKFWHHQHKIVAIEGGVLMTDIVTYQPPLGFLGAIANAVMIKKQLKQIFDFRTVAIEKRFGQYSLPKQNEGFDKLTLPTITVANILN